MTSEESQEKAEDSKNDMLSMFFDYNFVPHDFLDAVFTSALSTQKPTMQNKSLEFASPRALQSLQSKCSSLLTHMDYYTNELTRQFNGKMRDLDNSSSIISISGGSGDNSFSERDGISRLEYYVGNLTSALNSVSRDLVEANAQAQSVAHDSSFKETEQSVADLQRMLQVKERIGQVIAVFERVRSLVASESEETGAKYDSLQGKMAPTGKADGTAADESANVTIESFRSALSLLKELILEQVSTERRKVQADPNNYRKPKEEFVSILDGMIDLAPFFRRVTKFNQAYTQFVEFLRKERDSYLNIFQSV